MTRKTQSFIRPDGSVDTRAAMEAGRVARGEAFANAFFWRSKSRSAR